jgi:hypothetical protein
VVVGGVLGVHALGRQHEQHPDQAAVLDAGLHVGAHGRHQLAVVALEQLHASHGVVLLVPLEHGHEELGLAREVVQQPLARHTGLGGDRIDRDAAVATLGEHADRHLEDAVARSLALGGREGLGHRARRLRAASEG